MKALPHAREPMPKGDVIGGAGKFGREVVKQGIAVFGGAGIVVHEGSLPCKTAYDPAVFLCGLACNFLRG